MMKNKINWLGCLLGIVTLGTFPVYAEITMTPEKDKVFSVGEEVTLSAEYNSEPRYSGDKECEKCDKQGNWERSGDDPKLVFEGDDVMGENTLNTESPGKKSGYVKAKIKWECMIMEESSGDEDETIEDEDTFAYTVVKVEFDSVEGADDIGESGGEKIYATAQGEGDITVKLKITPDDAKLPDDFIDWSGGTAGSKPEERTLSKGELKVSGEAVGAKVGKNDVVKTKLYVFESEPKDWDVEKVIEGIDVSNPNENPEIWDEDEAEVFGATVTGDTLNPDTEYKIYYKNKEWYFYLVKTSKLVRWGYRDCGRAKIVEDKKYSKKSMPPLGRKMTNFGLYGYEERKNAVILDFTPNGSSTVPDFDQYICLEIVIKHEKYHFANWKNDFYKKGINFFKDILKYEKFSVDVNNLNPKLVLDDNKKLIDDKLKEELKKQMGTYKIGSESRAARYSNTFCLKIIENFE